MAIQINLTNRWLYTLVVLSLFIIISVAALAVTDVLQRNDVVFGHFGDEVYVQHESGYITLERLLQIQEIPASRVLVEVDTGVITLQEIIDDNSFSPESIYFPDGVIRVEGSIQREYFSWSTALCPAGYKVLYGYFEFDTVVADPPNGCGRNSFIDVTFLGQYPIQYDGIEGWTTGTSGRCNKAIAYCAPR